ncbi:hypothetical protein BH10PSE19_BH10PSE19_06560 [soil metagenome]
MNDEMTLPTTLWELTGSITEKDDIKMLEDIFSGRVNKDVEDRAIKDQNCATIHTKKFFHT